MRRVTVWVSTVAIALAVLVGCGRPGGELSDLRIMVPNAPGSGYDLTARTAAKAIEDAGVARGVEVFNLPGGSGAVGLRRLIYEKGNGRLLMVMGLGLVGAQYTSGIGATLQQTTPVARLIEEPEVIVVTQDSPYASLGDLVAAWRADPASVTVGGGSSPGGPDHLAPMLMAKAIGLAPKSVSYVRYDGGGDLLAAILGKRVSFGVSGIGEVADQVESRQLRVLAVTSGKRVDGLPAPTLREAGVNVEFTNWRGIVAPPDLSAADLDALRAAVAQLHASAEWQRAIDTNGWTDAYLADDGFARFLHDENDRLATVLHDLGLA